MFTTKSLLVLFLLSKDFKRTFNWDPDNLNTPTADDVNTNPILSASPETSYIAAGSSQAIQNGQEQPRRDIVHLTHPRASVASQPISIPIPPPVQRSDSYDAVTASLEDGSYGMFFDPSSSSYDWFTAPFSSQQAVATPPSSPNTSQEAMIDNSLSQEYIPPIVGAGASGDSSGPRQNQIPGGNDDTDDNASQTDFQSDKSSSEEGFDRSGPSNMDPPSKIRIRIIRPESGTGISKGSRQTGSDASTEIQYEIEPQDYNWNNESSESQKPADKAQTDTDATSEFGDIDVDTEPETVNLNSLSPLQKYRRRMTILAKEAERLNLQENPVVEGMNPLYRDLLLDAHQKFLQGFKQTVFRKGKRAHEEIDGGSLNDQKSAGRYASQTRNRQMIRLMADEAERLNLPQGADGNGISVDYRNELMEAYQSNQKRLNTKKLNLKGIKTGRASGSQNAPDAT